MWVYPNEQPHLALGLHITSSCLRHVVLNQERARHAFGQRQLNAGITAFILRLVSQ